MKSKNANMGEAFRLWSELEPDGLLDRFGGDFRS
jgi:hypothetical protein